MLFQRCEHLVVCYDIGIVAPSFHSTQSAYTELKRVELVASHVLCKNDLVLYLSDAPSRPFIFVFFDLVNEFIVEMELIRSIYPAQVQAYFFSHLFPLSSPFAPVSVVCFTSRFEWKALKHANSNELIFTLCPFDRTDLSVVRLSLPSFLFFILSLLPHPIHLSSYHHFFYYFWFLGCFMTLLCLNFQIWFCYEYCNLRIGWNVWSDVRTDASVMRIMVVLWIGVGRPYPLAYLIRAYVLIVVQHKPSSKWFIPEIVYSVGFVGWIRARGFCFHDWSEFEYIQLSRMSSFLEKLTL